MGDQKIVYLQIKLNKNDKERLQTISSFHQRDMSKQVRYWINQDWQKLHPDQSQSSSGVADVKA